MKKFLIGLVVGAALTLFHSYVSPRLPSFMRSPVTFGGNYNDRAAAIIERTLEKDGVRPHYMSPSDDIEPELELGNEVTAAKARRAALAMASCGYDARVTTMPVDGGKLLVVIESKDLPERIVVFNNSWLWLGEPVWKPHRSSKYGIRRF